MFIQICARKLWKPYLWLVLQIDIHISDEIIFSNITEPKFARIWIFNVINWLRLRIFLFFNCQLR